MPELDALRAALRQSRTGEDADHLTEDQWERFACDELAADERQAALDHILECPLCTDTYRAVQMLRSEAAEFDEDAPAPVVALTKRADRLRFPWRGLGLLAMAATVLLAVVLPLRRGHEPIGDHGVMVVRDAGGEAAVIPVSPLDSVAWRSEDDVLMEWRMTESPASAAVEILDADGELIWTGPNTTSTEVWWPTEDIPGPGRYYWRVLIRDGSAVGSASELAAFDLRD